MVLLHPIQKQNRIEITRIRFDWHAAFADSWHCYESLCDTDRTKHHCNHKDRRPNVLKHDPWMLSKQIPKKCPMLLIYHDGVINWNYFPLYWPFVRGIHRSPVNYRTKPVSWSFDVIYDLRPNKRLSKQPWGKWFETPLHSLWRHCNVWEKQVIWMRRSLGCIGVKLASLIKITLKNRHLSNAGLRLTHSDFTNWSLCIKTLWVCSMMALWHGNAFRIADPLWGTCTNYRWITSSRASNESLFW